MTPKTTTLNNAVTEATAGSALMDFFAQGGALRGVGKERANTLLSNAYDEDPLRAVKMAFYFRDIRGGQGERDTFRIHLEWLANNHPDSLSPNLEHIGHFGRFDDLYALMDTPLEDEALFAIRDQLEDDIESEHPSLLAKWMKSENTSSPESCALGKKTRKYLGWTPKKYRQTLSALRSDIDVVERKMCSGEWSDIDFSHVPSKAIMNYRNAFLKHDETRWKEFLEQVQEGTKTIKSAALYPYDIIRKVLRENCDTNDKTVLDAQWKAMVEEFKSTISGNGIVVCDTSGSMFGYGDEVAPIDVAVSLAILFAEINEGLFANKFITFSENPKIQSIKGKNIYEKAGNLSQADWGMSTNIQKVFDTLLKNATTMSIPQEEMPDTVYIISDMEFNEVEYGIAGINQTNTNFEAIEAKYHAYGYKRPKLVYWNVDAKTQQSPVKADEAGTRLVSGCSPSILKSILTGNAFTPEDLMLEVIDDFRYDIIVA